MVKEKKRLVLVSCCGDPDYGKDFWDLFIKVYGQFDLYGNLQQGGIIRIFPYFGGAGHADHWDSFLKQAKAAYSGLNLTDILMAAHDPCRWYAWFGSKPPAHLKNKISPMKRDLMLRAKKFDSHCPNVEVRLFLGQPKEKGGPLIFDELNFL